jgi:hypothetical protein
MVLARDMGLRGGRFRINADHLQQQPRLASSALFCQLHVLYGMVPDHSLRAKLQYVLLSIALLTRLKPTARSAEYQVSAR